MAGRRERIRTVLHGRSIESQAQLQSLLAAEGIHVTQATLSRDLDAIGAVKQIGDDGLTRYVMQEAATVSRLAPTAGLDAVSRIVGEVLLDADSAQNLAVLRTPPGAAMYLAGTLDRSALPDLLGTVAGDDTVMVVMRSTQAASDLCELLLRMAQRRHASTPRASHAPASTAHTRRRRTS